jgi:hypothetical protein
VHAAESADQGQADLTRVHDEHSLRKFAQADLPPSEIPRMPTPFQNAAAMASAAVDAIYGESFQLIAMKAAADVNASRLADAARPSFFAIGAYLAPFKSILPHARGSIQDDNAHKFAASTPMVSIDNANLQWPVETGDRVLRMATGDLFEVSNRCPTASGAPCCI